MKNFYFLSKLFLEELPNTNHFTSNQFCLELLLQKQNQTRYKKSVILYIGIMVHLLSSENVSFRSILFLTHTLCYKESVIIYIGIMVHLLSSENISFRSILILTHTLSSSMAIIIQLINMYYCSDRLNYQIKTNTLHAHECMT